MPSANQDQALQHLKQWADRTGYQVGPIEGTGNDFILEVTERDTFPSVQFIHQRKEQPYLLVVGQVKVPQEDRQLLKRALGEGFKRFIWDLKLVLLDKGVDFIVIGEDEGDPDAWEVHLRIYVKEFDPNLLQGAYTRVKNSLIAVIWSYKRALDQAAMFSAGPSEQFPLPADDVDMDVAEDPGGRVGGDLARERDGLPARGERLVGGDGADLEALAGGEQAQAREVVVVAHDEDPPPAVAAGEVRGGV
ncbi:MAG TPA: DUF2299 family protein, partial [Methanomassiliicoccales archaeon]|nr:DUF2299 family protein [Methanomassiliicoccales archaeon]